MSECNDEEMIELLSTINAADADPTVGLKAVDAKIAKHMGDARLHFLRGSLLAGSSRPIEAYAALSRAVELDPAFPLARFQLGLFELTSGEAERALSTWAPLDGLPAGHYLASFVEGLRHLIRDEFSDCVASLRIGISANTENLPLNRDMQLVIDQCEQVSEPGQNVPQRDEASATSFLLDQFGRGTMH